MTDEALAYEFNTKWYATKGEMLHGMAFEWLRTYGNDATNEYALPDPRERLRLSAAELADHCVEHWGLSHEWLTWGRSHMIGYGYTRDDLVEAFGLVKRATP